jgi:hypothetical protein
MGNKRDSIKIRSANKRISIKYYTKTKNCKVTLKSTFLALSQSEKIAEITSLKTDPRILDQLYEEIARDDLYFLAAYFEQSKNDHSTFLSTLFDDAINEKKWEIIKIFPKLLKDENNIATLVADFKTFRFPRKCLCFSDKEIPLFLKTSLFYTVEKLADLVGALVSSKCWEPIINALTSEKKAALIEVINDKLALTLIDGINDFNNTPPKVSPNRMKHLFSIADADRIKNRCFVALPVTEQAALFIEMDDEEKKARLNVLSNEAMQSLFFHLPLEHEKLFIAFCQNRRHQHNNKRSSVKQFPYQSMNNLLFVLKIKQQARFFSNPDLNLADRASAFTQIVEITVKTRLLFSLTSALRQAFLQDLDIDEQLWILQFFPDDFDTLKTDQKITIYQKQPEILSRLSAQSTSNFLSVLRGIQEIYNKQSKALKYKIALSLVIQKTGQPAVVINPDKKQIPETLPDQKIDPDFEEWLHKTGTIQTFSQQPVNRQKKIFIAWVNQKKKISLGSAQKYEKDLKKNIPSGTQQKIFSFFDPIKQTEIFSAIDFSPNKKKLFAGQPFTAKIKLFSYLFGEPYAKKLIATDPALYPYLAPPIQNEFMLLLNDLRLKRTLFLLSSVVARSRLFLILKRAGQHLSLLNTFIPLRQSYFFPALSLKNLLICFKRIINKNTRKMSLIQMLFIALTWKQQLFVFPKLDQPVQTKLLIAADKNITYRLFLLLPTKAVKIALLPRLDILSIALIIALEPACFSCLHPDQQATIYLCAKEQSALVSSLDNQGLMRLLIALDHRQRKKLYNAASDTNKKRIELACQEKKISVKLLIFGKPKGIPKTALSPTTRDYLARNASNSSPVQLLLTLSNIPSPEQRNFVKTLGEEQKKRLIKKAPQTFSLLTPNAQQAYYSKPKRTRKEKNRLRKAASQKNKDTFLSLKPTTTSQLSSNLPETLFSSPTELNLSDASIRSNQSLFY